MNEPSSIARAQPLVGECIGGDGERTRLGYVRVWREGRRHLAHRLAYEAAKGPIPDGMELDHLCRNRWCRNPDHLQPVTHAENSRRSSKCKLDFNQADRIRELFATGRYSLAELGQMFGVTKQSIALITKGKQWTR